MSLKALEIALIFLTFNLSRGMIAGLMKALGWIKEASYIPIVCQYFIGIPLALVLWLNYGKGVYALQWAFGLSTAL